MVIQAGHDVDFFRSTFGSDERVDEVLDDLAPGEIADGEFARLATFIPTLCWIANSDGYIVWYNQGWHDYTGTTPEEMEGWGWQSVHDPALLPEVMERWRVSIETGHPFEMIFPLRGKDGTFRPFLTRVRPVRDAQGKIKRWYGLNAGIAAQIEAETALRENEHRLMLIQQIGRIGGFDYAVEADLATCTDELYEIFGVPRSESITIGTLATILHPDDRDEILAEVDEALANGQGLDQRYRIIRPNDGEIRWLSSQSRPIFKAGKLTRLVGGVTDVTETHRAAVLREAQNNVLQLAMKNCDVEETLGALLTAVEQISQSGMKGSILVLSADGQHLTHGAAPSLPTAYNEAIDGIEIGPAVGSCGTAAYSKQVVHVSDIANDPLWANFKDLALAHDLAACWSTPILSGSGEVLGTFAMYYDVPRNAEPDDLHLVEFVTRSASLVIERARTEIELKEERKVLQTLNQLGKTLAGELNLKKLVQFVTDRSVELTGAEFGAFFYNVMTAGESYMLYTISGVDPDRFSHFPMPRATEIFAPTFKGEGVVRSDDITSDPRYGKNAPNKGMPKGHLPVKSYLAVPVIARSGEVLGGLFFGHPEAGRFSERHERIMVGVSGQAAIAIDNARLFESAQSEIAERAKTEAAIRDINATLEERVAEQIAAREKTEEALRQAQKMEAVGQLTGGIAHDFNNLLTIIGGNVDTVRRRLEDGVEPRVSRALTNAMTGVERAATLTQRLLAFSRRQPLDPKPVDANRLVSDMTVLLHRTLGETIEIETTLAPDIWVVEVDPNQLESALINLAVNARDAIGANDEGAAGKLTIETANVRIGRQQVLDEVDMESGEYVAICVSDNGSGMDEETRARAFEPFFTTKEVGKGTGLGLSMVYGFVKQSGGQIKIYSTEGKGTTIKLYLPRTKVKRAAGEGEETESEQIIQGQGTILVCEDDDDVRAYSVDLLRELGYVVLEAHDGPSALRLLERRKGEIDLLFTDVILPNGLTGAGVAEEALKIQPGLKVLFTTGYARDVIVHHGRLDEGINLLAKPFSYGDLARRIFEILGK